VNFHSLFVYIEQNGDESLKGKSFRNNEQNATM